MNQKEIVKKLTPKLLYKIKPSIGFLRKYGIQESNETYENLTRGALWIAAGEATQEEEIFSKAKSILIKWILEDIQPVLAENLRKKNKRHRIPTEDFFTLPWGAKVGNHSRVVHPWTIDSGTKTGIPFAIAPNYTDKDLLIE